MTGSFYSVSTLLNQMIMACYEVKRKQLGVRERMKTSCSVSWSFLPSPEFYCKGGHSLQLLFMSMIGTLPLTQFKARLLAYSRVFKRFSPSSCLVFSHSGSGSHSIVSRLVQCFVLIQNFGPEWISGQLLDGLEWNLVHIFMVCRGWMPLALVFPWLPL